MPFDAKEYEQLFKKGTSPLAMALTILVFSLDNEARDRLFEIVDNIEKKTLPGLTVDKQKELMQALEILRPPFKVDLRGN